MDNVQLEEAIAIWSDYRKLHPKSPLLPILAFEHERNRIDQLANKIKMYQWTNEPASDEVLVDFVNSVNRWRDIVTVDILQHGSI